MWCTSLFGIYCGLTAGAHAHRVFYSRAIRAAVRLMSCFHATSARKLNRSSCDFSEMICVRGKETGSVDDLDKWQTTISGRGVRPLQIT